MSETTAPLSGDVARLPGCPRCTRECCSLNTLGSCSGGCDDLGLHPDCQVCDGDRQIFIFVEELQYSVDAECPACHDGTNPWYDDWRKDRIALRAAGERERRLRERDEAWRQLVLRADSMLSLIAHRGNVQWGGPCVEMEEAMQRIGMLRRAYEKNDPLAHGGLAPGSGGTADR